MLTGKNDSLDKKLFELLTILASDSVSFVAIVSGEVTIIDPEQFVKENGCRKWDTYM